MGRAGLLGSYFWREAMTETFAKLASEKLSEAARKIADGIVDKLRLSGIPVLPETHEALIFWAEQILTDTLGEK